MPVFLALNLAHRLLAFHRENTVMNNNNNNLIILSAYGAFQG